MAARAEVGFREPAGHHAADEARGLEHDHGLAGARSRYGGGYPGRRRTENHDVRRDDLEHVLGGRRGAPFVARTSARKRCRPGPSAA